MIRCVRWLWLPLDAFDDWVRTPVDPRPLAFYRFWFGFLCLVHLLLLWNDLPMWLAVSSFSWRNMNILHSGDNLIRIGCFFLMFAHSGEAFTLRRWIATRRAGVGLKPFRHIPAWTQRILQLQLCVAYFVAGIWKATGVAWQSGTAVGTVLQLGELQRFLGPLFSTSTQATAVGPAATTAGPACSA